MNPFQAKLVRAKPADGSDAALIAFQKICPVTGGELGSMGAPVKVQVGEEAIFLCCRACEGPFEAETAKYLERLRPPPEGEVLSIPEGAVIDTGRKQVVFVEREPGVFEGVEVELGPRTGGYYPVLQGLSPGDKVAGAGSFLLDAETRLNPAAASAYFGASGGSVSSEPTSSGAQMSSDSSAVKANAATLSASDLENILQLPAEERDSAIAQAICPVTGEQLGSMGVPIKVMVNGKPVFLCCNACRDEAAAHPEKILNKLKEHQSLPQPSENVPTSSDRAHQHHGT
jgi:hypothetical protein